jgi:hypothetical protein
MVMASFITIRILFYFLFLFTIIHTINIYPLYDLQNVEQNHVQLRSVLWPKMCIKILKRLNRHRHSLDVNNNEAWHQVKRKCYPYDKP